MVLYSESYIPQVDIMFNHPLRSLARIGIGSSVLVACDTEKSPPVFPSIGCHQYVANKFIEDRIVVSRLELSGAREPVQFIAVMDGHGGPQLAEYLTRKLPELMHKKLSDNVRVPEAVKDAFLSADEEWYTTVKPVYDLGFTNPIKVGACAVAVVMDESEIVVGSVGDCKCVLVRSNGQTEDLNIQRNANLVEEQDRLRKLHPGEEDVVRCKRSWQEPVESGEVSRWTLPWTKKQSEQGRQKTVFSGCYVKGRLQPTKSFGDFHLKTAAVEFDHERGRPFLDPGNKKSFPYIDAYPDVTVTRRTTADKFLIVGTDGLWDQFTSREAAGIVEAAISAGLTADQAAIELVEAALMRAATNHKMELGEMKALAPGSSRQPMVLTSFQAMLASAGKASLDFHNHLTLKQSGFLCCWTFDDYMYDGETHAAKASRAFAHASGIAKNEDLKALATRAAQHTSTAQQLGSLASKEL